MNVFLYFHTLKNSFAWTLLPYLQELINFFFLICLFVSERKQEEKTFYKLRGKKNVYKTNVQRNGHTLQFTEPFSIHNETG